MSDRLHWLQHFLNPICLFSWNLNSCDLDSSVRVILLPSIQRPLKSFSQLFSFLLLFFLLFSLLNLILANRVVIVGRIYLSYLINISEHLKCLSLPAPFGRHFYLSLSSISLDLMSDFALLPILWFNSGLSSFLLQVFVK